MLLSAAYGVFALFLIPVVFSAGMKRDRRIMQSPLAMKTLLGAAGGSSAIVIGFIVWGLTHIGAYTATIVGLLLLFGVADAVNIRVSPRVGTCADSCDIQTLVC